ncbi:MAG: glycosyltransferase family 39 protein [Pyrinomonadaceae bacterium]
MAGNLKFSSTTRGLVQLNPRPAAWFGWHKERLRLLASLEWTTVGTLALLVVLGFSLRANQLGAIGFAEDEMNKLDAVRAYEQKNFAANGEHPMLMKVLMLASLHSLPATSEEAALRIPNALLGALTVVPLFLLTAAFFDRWTALLAAAFWALGVNAITHNRIGKEDTLLVFFMLFGFYFFLRAKQNPPTHVKTRRRNYMWSAISFGLMIASKYFPHYFGLNMLYHHNFRVRQQTPGESGGKTPAFFYILICVVFLLANPAVLLPEVWNYMNAYLGEHLLTHSGYLFGDHLYKNNMSSSPFWGTPIYFYFVFLIIKVPLLIVAAFIVGFAISIKRRREPAYAFLIFMFLFWIVPYSLIGGKWLRYTLSLMPLVYMFAAVGVMALVRVTSLRLGDRKNKGVIVAAAAVVIFVGIPAAAGIASGPHYALYTNALGSNRAGYYFPHDEFYDDGVREAIKYVCDIAPLGSTIAHETPAVARYYLRVYNRQDLHSHAISEQQFNVAEVSGPTYVIVQRGRTYFENRDELAVVQNTFSKAYEVKINNATAAEVYAKP